MPRWNPFVEPDRPFRLRAERGGKRGESGEYGETPDNQFKMDAGGLDKIVPSLISHHTMVTTSSALERYQAQLVNDSLTAGALKFGSFTLKSGRCDQLMISCDRSAPQINLNSV